MKNRKPYTTRFEVGYKERPHAMIPKCVFIFFPHDNRNLITGNVYISMKKGLRIRHIGAISGTGGIA